MTPKTPWFKRPAEHFPWKNSGRSGPAERVYESERVNTQKINNNSNLTTVLRRCYGDDVRLFNKAKIYYT